MASHPDVQTFCCNLNCVGTFLCFFQCHSMCLRVFVTTFMIESLALLRETQGSFSFCVMILMLFTMSKAQWKASTTMTGAIQGNKEKRLNIYSRREKIKFLLLPVKMVTGWLTFNLWYGYLENTTNEIAVWKLVHAGHWHFSEEKLSREYLPKQKLHLVLISSLVLHSSHSRSWVAWGGSF